MSEKDPTISVPGRKVSTGSSRSIKPLDKRGAAANSFSNAQKNEGAASRTQAAFGGHRERSQDFESMGIHVAKRGQKLEAGAASGVNEHKVGHTLTELANTLREKRQAEREGGQDKRINHHNEYIDKLKSDLVSDSQLGGFLNKPKPEAGQGQGGQEKQRGLFAGSVRDKTKFEMTSGPQRLKDRFNNKEPEADQGQGGQEKQKGLFAGSVRDKTKFEMTVGPKELKSRFNEPPARNQNRDKLKNELATGSQLGGILNKQKPLTPNRGKIEPVVKKETENREGK